MTMKEKLKAANEKLYALKSENNSYYLVEQLDVVRKLIKEVIAEMDDQQAALYPKNWKKDNKS